MSAPRIEFSGGTGETLAARLELPLDQEPRAFAIFAHCFTCSKNLNAVVHISRALAAQGIGVLRFDFTGLGESSGEFADTNFSSNVADLVAAADYLEAEHSAPELLVGHSLGGAAVLAAAARLDGVRAVATIGAPSEPAHVERLFRAGRTEIETTGEAEVDIGGRSFRIKKQFLDDISEACSEEAIGRLSASLLICHSPVDEIVDISNAERIYRAARHPKSFLSLDRANHLLTDSSDSQYVGLVLAAWADRYLAGRDDAPALPIAGEGSVVTRTASGGFQTEIRAGRHSLRADEPIRVGGTDRGPTPYDLLLAGLGACTSMTLRMYADRKGWPLEAAQVRLEHSREHLADCAECEKGAQIDVIQRSLSLEGPLDDAQRRRLIEIAERCPVHRTLERGARISTTLEA